MKKLTAEAMIASVKNGKGKMPSYKDKLTDAQIKDVVTYYRGLK
jgi:mono/diheme cytochrome c family protein